MNSTAHSIMMNETNIDIEKLICEVQKRPALWDMTKKDYSDRLKRKQCWDEIVEVFSFENDLTLDDKQKLGDILHKKWKNIRDRYTRDVQERKGKTGDAPRKKAPYMYSYQLEFLRDTVAPKKTASSLEYATTESLTEKECEGRQYEEKVDDPQGGSSSIRFSPRTQVGKKRLHPVEEQILRSLERNEKQAKIDRAAKEDNDNRHFLLSLLPLLESLPRNINFTCRIEIMQCISKYQTISQQHQQPFTFEPTTRSFQHLYNPNQHQSQQHLHHTQMNVLPLSSSSSLLTPTHSRTFSNPGPTASPAESVSSYISSFTVENDSEVSSY